MSRKNPKDIIKSYCIDRETWEEFYAICEEDREPPGTRVYKLIRKEVLSHRNSNKPIVEDSLS